MQAASPDPLLSALEQFAERLPGRAAAKAAEELTGRYRTAGQPRLGRLTPDEIVAYAVSRMPATYAASRAALRALAAAAPDLGLRRVLDLGGGLGAAGHAATATFPMVDSVTVVDADPAMIAAGKSVQATIANYASTLFTWSRADLLAAPAGGWPEADLVTVAYVLSELPANARNRVVRVAGRAATSAVLVLEPGTPDGYRRVLEARSALIALGLTVAAPCPHDLECPLSAGSDWCHFATRLTRSPAHRSAKQGRLGYEDEKFAYVAAVRPAVARDRRPGRIIRHPTWRKSLVELHVCQPDESRAEHIKVPRSAGAAYRSARDASWGDTWPAEVPAGPRAQ